MTTSGQKTTTGTDKLALVGTARLRPSRAKVATVAMAMALALALETTGLLQGLMAQATVLAQVSIGMLMAEIRTLNSLRHMIKLKPSPTLQSLTTSGTTQTTTSMVLKPGARTAMSMVLPPMAQLPLRTITVLVDMEEAKELTAQQATEAIGLRQLPLLLHMVRLRPATITTSGPSSLTDRTTTRDGVNPTTLSTQSPMMTFSSHARYMSMTTSGQRTTTGGETLTLVGTARLPSRARVAMADTADMADTITDDEHLEAASVNYCFKYLMQFVFMSFKISWHTLKNGKLY